MENKNTEFIIFKTEDEKVAVDMRMDDETVWLTQDQMAMLFDKARSTIAEHILNVFKEGELDEKTTCWKFRQVRTEGSRTGTSNDNERLGGTFRPYFDYEW